jgi:hypothetical protein
MLNIFTIVKGLVLRGKFRKFWILLRSRQTEKKYLSKISNTTKLLAANDSLSASKPCTPLRRILFIGDLMWEEKQLFPELKRIAELDVLDLGPPIATGNSVEPASSALIAIEALKLEHEPDLIFFYARPQLLNDCVFDAIRRKWKCPILGMSLDDRIEFYDNIKRAIKVGYGHWANKFDYNITSCRLGVQWYREAGATVSFMPQGFTRNIRYKNPPTSYNYQHTMSFVGTHKPERESLISKINSYGLNVAVYGNGWPDAGWLEDPVDVFRNSQMNLGIGAILASGNITCLKGRDIECPATGSCYITTYHWELPDLFEIGKEILCYRNYEELIEMYAYYSKKPESCLKIAQAAHRRAHAEHTWEMRMRKVFHDMGFAQ